MPPEDLERKLAAILSADVAGYSRLMREAAAVAIAAGRETSKDREHYRTQEIRTILRFHFPGSQ